MAQFNKFNNFVSDLAQRVHNLNVDALKIMLTNTPPSLTSTIKANIVEIAAVNGYVAGGMQPAFISGNDINGLYRLILAPVFWTAIGGSIGPFQFAVLYNSSTQNGNLIGFWDYGASLTLTNGNTFAVGLDQVNGTLTLQ